AQNATKRAEMQAQVEIEQARMQSIAMAAAAQQASAPGIPQVAGPNGETQVSQTSSAVPSQGLGGVNGHANGKAAKNGKRGASAPVPIAPGARMGRTDTQWFGPLLGEVTQLRDGVKRYIESLSMQPPRLTKDGQPDGISVDQATAGIIQA